MCFPSVQKSNKQKKKKKIPNNWKAYFTSEKSILLGEKFE